MNLDFVKAAWTSLVGHIQTYVELGLVAVLGVYIAIAYVQHRDIHDLKVSNEALQKTNQEQVQAITQIRINQAYNDALTTSLQANKDMITKAINDAKRTVHSQPSAPASPALVCAITGVCNQAPNSGVPAVPTPAR